MATKQKKFKQAMKMLQSAKDIWDWDEQSCAVENAVDFLVEEGPPTPQQIDEFIDCSVHNKLEVLPYVYDKLLSGASDETITNVIKTLIKYYGNKDGKKSYYADAVSQILINILNEHPERKTQIETIAREHNFEDVFAHKMFADPKMLKMLETVNTAIKNNDKRTLKIFQLKLSKMSEKEIYQIDHAAMEYLVNNFTQENFDKVNNLRVYWGLKAVISEESLTEKNLRDIRRMEFSHNVSVTQSDNPHYEHTYSDVYKNFVPDYNQEYEPKEYIEVLKSSPAVQMLNEHGLSSFTKQLPEVLSKQHVPPSIVSQLLVKDLQHLLIEHHSSKLKNYDRRSIFDYDEVGIEHQAAQARKTFWQEVVKDKKLVKFISKDLKKKGIDQETIDKIWERAEKYGNPNALVFDTYENCYDKVDSVIFNVHHRVALKDGGKNEPDNFVIVVVVPGKVNSHRPLHEYDNPLMHLYKHKEIETDGIIISDQKRSTADKEIRLNTVFTTDEENEKKNINKKVLYYGGPKCSMYVGKVHTAVQSALNKINKICEMIQKKNKGKMR